MQAEEDVVMAPAPLPQPQPAAQGEANDSEAAAPQEEMPFTEAELETTFKVLDVVAKRKELLGQSNMRMFRKHLAPVTELMEGRKFGGVGRKKYLEDKAIREEKRARHNQRKMHDRRHINSSALRRERLSKLESLLEQGKDDAGRALPMIADGVAGEDVCHSTADLIGGPEPALKKLCQDETEQAREEKATAEKKEASALLGFRSCYTCKSRFDKIHHFYDQLCPRCAGLNFSKRFQTADLRGKVALVTGARVKIGFQAAVKLLLGGAAVIATTRFPKDAAERFAKHPEYATFKDRLQIFGIDFRDLVHLEQFLDFVLTRYSRLDMIVHNACQTVRRPPTYYKHLVEKETKALEASGKEVQMLMDHQHEFEAHVKSLALPTSSAEGTAGNVAAHMAMSSALKSQVPLIAGEDHADDHASAFPEGLVDVNGQQVDLRSRNSWLLRIGEVATPEVAEVFAINTLAPFIMNNRLMPLLEKSGATEKKFIVNVSAMEGKFYRYKTPNHPHTNMAKAALNMMTRTCAEDLSKRRIYMNSVDTGWINDENPLAKAHAHAEAANFQTPIDEIDAAARVLDPIFVGYNSDDVVFGKFLKDFHETECKTKSPKMKVDTRVDNKKFDLAPGSKVWCATHPVLHHKLTKLRDERTDSRVFRNLLREVTFYLGLRNGMYRNKQSLLPVQYYNKLPKECNADVAIVLEPVIATGGKGPKTQCLHGRRQSFGHIACEVCAKHPDVEIFLAAIDEGLTEVHAAANMELNDVQRLHRGHSRKMTKDQATPPLLKTHSKDPLESSWRAHMVRSTPWAAVSGVRVADGALCMVCDCGTRSPRQERRAMGARRLGGYEISPNKVAEEDCRVCDACIRVIDEKLALGVSRRFGKGMAAAAASESDNQRDHAAAAPLAPDKGSNRTVMTMGRYSTSTSWLAVEAGGVSRVESGSSACDVSLVEEKGGRHEDASDDQVGGDEDDAYDGATELAVAETRCDPTTSPTHLVISTANHVIGSERPSRLRTPAKIARPTTPGKSPMRRSSTAGAAVTPPATKPRSLTVTSVPPSASRLGMAARTTPRALEKKIQRVGTASDLAPRSGGVSAAAGAEDGATKRPSAMEVRRAYSQSMKARLNGTTVSSTADGSSELKRTNSSSSLSSISSSTGGGVASLTRDKGKSTTSLGAARRKTLHDLVESNKEDRRSSLGSQSSCSSISSSATSASVVSAASSRTTQRMKSNAMPPRKTERSRGSSSSAMMSSPGRHKAPTSTHKVWPASAPSMTMLPEEFTLDEDSVQALKEDHELAEKGVQELLSYLALSTSSSSAPTAMNMKTRLEEMKLLKAGLRRLSAHNEGLMVCCEAFERRTLEQSDYVDASAAEIERLTRLLSGEAAKHSDPSKTLLPELDLEDLRDGASLSRSPHPTSDSETASTTSSQNIFPRMPTEEAERQRLEIVQAMQEDSPLSAYVRALLKKATDKIEDKWRTRFAEQITEHEQALTQERERSSASVLSSSRLVTETLHGKDDELKAVQEAHITLGMQKRQLELDLDAARAELDFMKQQVDDEDDERSSNAHSFWEKTTDLAKKNRAIAEDLAQANKTIDRLNETIKIMKSKASSLKLETGERVREAKSMAADKNLLQDKLAAMEAKFEDEKSRREQFQVNVEQLTVENTALYAQMVALQTTHEAKMEELQARYEKRNISLAGEMKVLQTQNRLMRSAEPSTSREPIGRGSTIGSSVSGSESITSLFSRPEDKELSQRMQELTDELLAARQELTEKADQIADLEMKIAEGETIRRKLHNVIQELRGNIRVHVRLRPFLRADGDEGLAENPQSAIRCDTFASTITTNVDNPHTFAFDKIYGQSESQENVFQDVADFIQSAMDGYNVCIFAYGQTGSGKTHTMQGSGKAQMRGIIPRAIDLIIDCCNELTSMGWQFSLDVTFYEIYNEVIRDLLVSYNGNDEPRKHNIRTDRRGKNYVEGLTQVTVDFAQAAEQVEEIVNLAACNRSVDRTDMNAHSSRSHSIFALQIHGFNEAQNTEVVGSLSLVDLAGSERLSRSHATGDRLKEAQAINKSLSSLADVFQALAKKSSHVPYRNSKLTYALQPALSGDGKTLMMANLSPTFASLDESLCSMRFAQNVSQCELGAPVRQIKSRVSSSSPDSSFSRSFGSGSIRSSPPREARRSTFTPGSLKKLL
ncbi:hypothetical protein BBJ28_00003051 [Nothophytophthora sp. Chile5]|nr:hypothetical protein BBJ28_00003051 [Nothophytophthora sp. Chile5]